MLGRLGLLAFTLSTTVFYVGISDGCKGGSGVVASDLLTVIFGSISLGVALSFLVKVMKLQPKDVGELASELNNIYGGAILILLGSTYTLYATLKGAVKLLLQNC